MSPNAISLSLERFDMSLASQVHALSAALKGSSILNCRNLGASAVEAGLNPLQTDTPDGHP